jgi:hypothetical protein
MLLCCYDILIRYEYFYNKKKKKNELLSNLILSNELLILIRFLLSSRKNLSFCNTKFLHDLID